MTFREGTEAYDPHLSREIKEIYCVAGEELFKLGIIKHDHYLIAYHLGQDNDVVNKLWIYATRPEP